MAILPPENVNGYDYEVSATGFANALGNVMVDYQNVTEEVTLLPPSDFTVTFTVTDGTSPVQGAVIDINNTQLTTDVAGQASIDLENGNYPYTVTAAGFLQASGSVTVNGAAVDETVTLQVGYNVTFNVDMGQFGAKEFNPDTDDVFVTGSPFGWSEPGTEGSLQLTDPDGDLIYSGQAGIPVGSHEYKYFYLPEGTASSWDYGEWDGGSNRSLEVVDAPVVLNDHWNGFEVTFHVTDQSGTAISGAVVAVNNDNLTTDADGLAMAILPPENVNGYDYEVSATGFANALGNVMVDYQNVTEEVTLYEPDYFMVTFLLDMKAPILDGTFEPDADEVFISGNAFDWAAPGTNPELELTDSDGDSIYSLQKEIAVGTYEYKYFMVPEGVGASWSYGEWQGGENRILEVTNQAMEVNDIWGAFVATFHVTSETGEDLTGAEIAVDNTIFTTDESGLAMIPLAPAITYDFTVEAFGFELTAGSVTMGYEDTTVEINMTPLDAWQVTFVINDDGNPVENAAIFLDGYGTVLSNEQGQAVFSEVYTSDSIYYSVTASDYIFYEDSIAVASDTTETVTLLPVSISSVSFSDLKVWPNPVKNTLTIETGQLADVRMQIYNSNGQLVMDKQLHHQAVIDTDHWKQGLYFVKLINNTNIRTIKIVKP
jgi:hypothetical protein